MRIGEKTDLDHHPVKVWIKREGRRKERNKGEDRRWRSVWNESVEEGRRDFARRVGRVRIEENWDSLKNRVKKALREAEEEGNGIKEKRRSW